MKRFLLSHSARRLQQKSILSQQAGAGSFRFLSSSSVGTKSSKSDADGDDKRSIKHVSSGLPDYIEDWDRNVFRKVGYGLTAITAASACNTLVTFEEQTVFLTAGLGAITGAYWLIGKRDIEQKSQTIRRNFPVLGNLRYLLEMIRPEIRQYVSVKNNLCCKIYVLSLQKNDLVSKTWLVFYLIYFLLLVVRFF